MQKYIVEDVKKITDDTVLLTLIPKNGTPKLDFYSGQYAAIGFRRGFRPSPVRCFSIVSSPNDDKKLQFGIKILGDFTKTVAQLKKGAKIFVHGPFGDFGLDEEYDKSAIMLAGGIGITPFISNIRYFTEEKSKVKLTLLYSNKDQSNIPFLKELKELEDKNPNFKVVHFITRGPIDKLKSYRVVKGRIDTKKLTKLTYDKFNNFTYFICGPKQFTTDLTKTLLDCGTNPTRIMAEEFTPTGADNLPNVINKKLTRWTYAFTAATLAIAVIGIMGIDLIRYVPKTKAIENTESSGSNTNVQSSSSNGSSTNSSAGSSTTSTTGSSTSVEPKTSSSTSSSSSSSKNTSTQNYQSPTTSVS